MAPWYTFLRALLAFGLFLGVVLGLAAFSPSNSPNLRGLSLGLLSVAAAAWLLRAATQRWYVLDEGGVSSQRLWPTPGERRLEVQASEVRCAGVTALRSNRRVASWPVVVTTEGEILRLGAPLTAEEAQQVAGEVAAALRAPLHPVEPLLTLKARRKVSVLAVGYEGLSHDLPDFAAAALALVLIFGSIVLVDRAWGLGPSRPVAVQAP